MYCMHCMYVCMYVYFYICTYILYRVYMCMKWKMSEYVE